MSVTLEIDGLPDVVVDDSFKAMSPDAQNSFVNQIRAQAAKGIKSSLGGATASDTATAAPVPANTQAPAYDLSMGEAVPQFGNFDPNAGPSQMPYGQQIGKAAGTIGRAADDAVRAVADGLTFGLADKAAAGARTLTGDAPSYGAALAQERARTDAVGQGVPGLNTGLRAAGGVMGGLGALRAGLSAGGAAINAGAGFLTKMAGFAADAAAAGAASGAGHVDTGNPADYGNAAASGAGWGAVTGAALPVAGSVLGAGYRAALPFFAQPVPGLTRTATGLLSNAITPRSAGLLDTLGSDAVLADASPGTQGLAQGVAARGDPAAEVVVDALKARQAAAPTRLNADLNTNLGPATSPVQLNAAMDAKQAATGPAYEAALQGAPPVDTTNALAEIGRQLNSSPVGSPERAALTRARTMLMQQSDQGVPTPVTDARTLLNARRTLDDMITYGDPLSGLSPGAAAAEGSPINTVRSALDSDLKASVPGLANADLTFATAARGKDAVQVGQGALAGGQNAMWPQDLANHFNSLPLEGQALARGGARASVQTQVGTNPNDLASLRRTFGDVQDFNRAKAGILFGDQPTQNVLNAIDREGRFAETAGPAIAGSRTTPMALASKAIDEATAPADPTFPKNLTWLGALAHGGEWAVRKGANAMAGVTGDATRQSLANALIAPEPQRSAIVQGLLADQLLRAQRGQAISGLLSSPAVARGLLAARRDQ